MNLREELKQVWDDLPEPTRDDWIVIGALVFMASVCIGLYLIGQYVPHQVAICSPSDVFIADPNFEWSVPVGSPEIGMRPDGSIGSINPYGRISAC